jgi:hypothetical protein
VTFIKIRHTEENSEILTVSNKKCFYRLLEAAEYFSKFIYLSNYNKIKKLSNYNTYPTLSVLKSCQ